MHVLSRMLSALVPGGLVLDLQVVRPDPRVESAGRVVCEIEGERLFRSADAARGAIDAAIAAGGLAEEAVDDHDVLCHYANGRELLDDFAAKERRVPAAAMPVLRALDAPVVLRERCRLRRLRRLTPAASGRAQPAGDSPGRR